MCIRLGTNHKVSDGQKTNNITGLILSVQSNQFVQSKTQFVQSKMRNCAVQKHKVEDIIVQCSKSILITTLRS